MSTWDPLDLSNIVSGDEIAARDLSSAFSKLESRTLDLKNTSNGGADGYYRVVLDPTANVTNPAFEKFETINNVYCAVYVLSDKANTPGAIENQPLDYQVIEITLAVGKSFPTVGDDNITAVKGYVIKLRSDPTHKWDIINGTDKTLTFLSYTGNAGNTGGVIIGDGDSMTVYARTNGVFWYKQSQGSYSITVPSTTSNSATFTCRKVVAATNDHIIVTSEDDLPATIKVIYLDIKYNSSKAWDIHNRLNGPNAGEIKLIIRLNNVNTGIYIPNGTSVTIYTDGISAYRLANDITRGLGGVLTKTITPPTGGSLTSISLTHVEAANQILTFFGNNSDNATVDIEMPAVLEMQRLWFIRNLSGYTLIFKLSDTNSPDTVTVESYCTGVIFTNANGVKNALINTVAETTFGAAEYSSRLATTKFVHDTYSRFSEVNISGKGEYVLTDDQARMASISLIGVITENTTVKFPTYISPRLCVVYNNTTPGDTDGTVSIASGGASVAIPRGSRYLINNGLSKNVRSINTLVDSSTNGVLTISTRPTDPLLTVEQTYNSIIRFEWPGSGTTKSIKFPYTRERHWTIQNYTTDTVELEAYTSNGSEGSDTVTIKPDETIVVNATPTGMRTTLKTPKKNSSNSAFATTEFVSKAVAEGVQQASTVVITSEGGSATKTLVLTSTNATSSVIRLRRSLPTSEPTSDTGDLIVEFPVNDSSGQRISYHGRKMTIITEYPIAGDSATETPKLYIRIGDSGSLFMLQWNKTWDFLVESGVFFSTGKYLENICNGFFKKSLSSDTDTYYLTHTDVANMNLAFDGHVQGGNVIFPNTGSRSWMVTNRSTTNTLNIKKALRDGSASTTFVSIAPLATVMIHTRDNSTGMSATIETPAADVSGDAIATTAFVKGQTVVTEYTLATTANGDEIITTLGTNRLRVTSRDGDTSNSRTLLLPSGLSNILYVQNDSTVVLTFKINHASATGTATVGIGASAILSIGGNNIKEFSETLPVGPKAKCLVKIGETTATAYNKYNIKSVTRKAPGKYEVFFSKPLANADYCVTATACHSDTTTGNVSVSEYIPAGGSRSTQSFILHVGRGSDPLWDPVMINIVVF